MSRISTYSNPEYCLSFGEDDCLFVDLKAEITKIGENQFELKIVNHQLVKSKMEFACFLVKHLSEEGLVALNNEIKAGLISELQGNLFTLYYAGDIATNDLVQDSNLPPS